MDIQVPKSNPRAFEEGFCKKHPALNLKTTAGSGSKWSDGDARSVIDRGKLQFAMEAKCRFSGFKLRPSPKEWAKAMNQLQKRNPDVVRLFAVYISEREIFPIPTYAVSIPNEDLEHLRRTGVEIVPADEQHTVSRDEKTWCYSLFEFKSWKSLYENIADWKSNFESE